MVRLPATALLLALLAACASTRPTTVTDPARPRAVGEDTPVHVAWGDPAGFAELRYSLNRQEAARGDWIVQLADYMQDKIAKTVPAGDRVDVDILDVQRAGQFEWVSSATDDVRVMRDVYPPRMTLRFRHTGADGTLKAEGERKIADLAYLQGPQPFPSNDPLRYDKRMIDNWIRKEFRTN